MSSGYLFNPETGEEWFKVGDTVRIVASDFNAPHLQPGRIGVITEILWAGECTVAELSIRPESTDEGIKPERYLGWHFYFDEIEKVEDGQ
jgi:hypothetical protein